LLDKSSIINKEKKNTNNSDKLDHLSQRFHCIAVLLDPRPEIVTKTPKKPGKKPPTCMERSIGR